MVYWIHKQQCGYEDAFNVLLTPFEGGNMTTLEIEQSLMRERWGKLRQVVPLEDNQKKHSVYLFGNTEHGWYKIGMSINPEQRLENFGGLPFEIKLIASVITFENPYMARLVERKLHKVYSYAHIRGEWFSTIETNDFLDKAKAVVESILSSEWKKSEEGQGLKYGSDKQQVAFFSVCST
jgi:hypothetical protein